MLPSRHAQGVVKVYLLPGELVDGGTSVVKLVVDGVAVMFSPISAQSSLNCLYIDLTTPFENLFHQQTLYPTTN